MGIKIVNYIFNIQIPTKQACTYGHIYTLIPEKRTEGKQNTLWTLSLVLLP